MIKIAHIDASMHVNKCSEEQLRLTVHGRRTDGQRRGPEEITILRIHRSNGPRSFTFLDLKSSSSFPSQIEDFQGRGHQIDVFDRIDILRQF